jgi:hypothetical protein
VKLGDELSEELNFRNSDCDPKGIANRNRKAQTKALRVNREMADGYLRGKKISALKLLIVRQLDLRCSSLTSKGMELYVGRFFLQLPN